MHAYEVQLNVFHDRQRAPILYSVDILYCSLEGKGRYIFVDKKIHKLKLRAQAVDLAVSGCLFHIFGDSSLSFTRLSKLMPVSSLLSSSVREMLCTHCPEGSLHGTAAGSVPSEMDLPRYYISGN